MCVCVCVWFKKIKVLGWFFCLFGVIGCFFSVFFFSVVVWLFFKIFFMNSCCAPHLEMSPKHFTVTIIALF